MPFYPIKPTLLPPPPPISKLEKKMHYFTDDWKLGAENSLSTLEKCIWEWIKHVEEAAEQSQSLHSGFELFARLVILKQPNKTNDSSQEIHQVSKWKQLNKYGSNFDNWETNVHLQGSSEHLFSWKAGSLEATWCSVLAQEKTSVYNEVVTKTFPRCVSNRSSPPRPEIKTTTVTESGPDQTPGTVEMGSNRVGLSNFCCCWLVPCLSLCLLPPGANHQGMARAKEMSARFLLSQLCFCACRRTYLSSGLPTAVLCSVSLLAAQHPYLAFSKLSAPLPSQQWAWWLYSCSPLLPFLLMAIAVNCKSILQVQVAAGMSAALQLVRNCFDRPEFQHVAAETPACSCWKLCSTGRIQQ